ncbi:MAG: VWA domain-containing protein [Bdellovibrionaceae bacterium]|nr:VWA domain-containing protein [Pseudobdellovibrionaceae bacterium]
MFAQNRFVLMPCLFFLLTTSCKLTSDNSVTETTTPGSAETTPVVDFSVINDTTQTPPPNDDPTVLPPPPTDPSDQNFQEGFSINNNAAYTNQSFVDLNFRTLAPSKIKVGHAMNCSDGIWETYIPEKRIALTELNKTLTYTVQFEDWEGSKSACYRQSITHDNIGPEIVFQTYPASSIEIGTASEITFYVRDDRSEIISMDCSMNSTTKPCLAGSNKVSLPAEIPIGNYTFTVSAKDDLNNITTKSITWIVHSLYKKVLQKITVNNYKKVDVLFVIDNSGSMEYEQKNMAQRTSQFLSILQGLDYQIAVTTTDPRNINLGDGRLISLTGGTGAKVITSSLPVSTAQNLLSQTLQRSETGSGDEQGIRAVYRAIERYNSNESELRSFLRNDAQLSVVLISDEDESANSIKNDPASLLSLIHATWGGQKRFNFNSIITRPGDSACHSTHGYTYGHRYASLSSMTGGVLGNVCDMDYTNQVTGIADEIRRLLKTLTLSCQPVNPFPIVIKKESTFVSQSYTLEGLNIKFTKELDPGSYEVEYTCLK